jgi:hypothetical protein
MHLGQSRATNDVVILMSSFIDVVPLRYGLPLSHDELRRSESGSDSCCVL